MNGEASAGKRTGNSSTVNSSGMATATKSGDDNWMGYLKSAVTNYLPYALPSQVTDVFTQGRAFASAVLQVAGLKHTCAITTIQKSLR